MIIENPSSSSNSLKHDYLAHAQTIVNHFLEALELNDCNVKIVVGFYQELQDTIDSIKDLKEAFRPTLTLTGPFKSKFDSRNFKPHTVSTPYAITDEGIQASIEALKEKCFNCKLSLPKVNFDADFKFLFNKLTFQLNVFKFNFSKDQLKPSVDICHTAFAFQRSCIPDILKLIAMLLQAAAAILALNKLPRISLGVFIKAIIGKLMAAIVASINISIDMSSTGLPCIIAALEELAAAVPTKENIANMTEMTPELKKLVLPDYQTISSYDAMLDESYKKGQITEEELIKKKAEYRKRQDPIRHYAKELKSSSDTIESKVNDSFKIVSDTVKKAQDEVNGYIEAILGLINFFECENTRSGADFSELIAWIKQLTDVINLISSVIAVYLAKIFRPILCKEGVTHKQLVDALIRADTKAPLSRADLTDIIQEFTGKESKINEDGTAVLVYDKPYKRLLPKLELMGCNIKDFAEAHTIDNLIRKVVEENSKNPVVNNEKDKPTPSRSTINVSRPVPNIKDTIRPGSWYKPIDVPLPRFTQAVYEKVPTPLLDKYRDRLNRRPGGIIFPVGKADTIRNKVNNLNGNNGFNIPNSNPWNSSHIPKVDKINIPIVGTIIKTVHPKTPTTVVGTVPINIPTTEKGSIVDDIDDIIDFIYTPPPKSNPTGATTPSTEDIDDLTSIISRLGEESKNSSSRPGVSPSTECRTFEDVMEKLNSLRI